MWPHKITTRDSTFGSSTWGSPFDSSTRDSPFGSSTRDSPFETALNILMTKMKELEKRKCSDSFENVSLDLKLKKNILKTQVLNKTWKN